MKKLFSLFFISAFTLGIMSYALAADVTPSANATVYYYDQENNDLIVLARNFPTHFLVNLNGSSCPGFTNGEELFVHFGNDQSPKITKLSTNQACEGVNGVVQIQGDFRTLTSVDPQNNILQTLDESGNKHKITYGPGCESAKNYVNQTVYLGTNWQEGELFLPNNAGQCHMKSSKFIGRQQ